MEPLSCIHSHPKTNDVPIIFLEEYTFGTFAYKNILQQ